MKTILSLYFLILGFASFSQHEFENELLEFSNKDSMCYRNNKIAECLTYIHYYEQGKLISKELYSRDIISNDGLLEYSLKYKSGDSTIKDTTYIRYNTSKKIEAVEHKCEMVCNRYCDTYEYNKAGQLECISFFSSNKKDVNELDSSVFICCKHNNLKYLVKKQGDTLCSVTYKNNTFEVKSFSEDLLVKYTNGVEVYRKDKNNITTTKYNEFNNPIIKETIDQNGNLIETIAFKYNGFNLLKDLTLLNDNGQIVHKQEYKYKISN